MKVTVIEGRAGRIQVECLVLPVDTNGTLPEELAEHLGEEVEIPPGDRTGLPLGALVPLSCQGVAAPVQVGLVVGASPAPEEWRRGLGRVLALADEEGWSTLAVSGPATVEPREIRELAAATARLLRSHSPEVVEEIVLVGHDATLVEAWGEAFGEDHLDERDEADVRRPHGRRRWEE